MSKLERIANELDAMAVPHERFAAEYGSKIAAADGAAYRLAARAVRDSIR